MRVFLGRAGRHSNGSSNTAATANTNRPIPNQTAGLAHQPDSSTTGSGTMGLGLTTGGGAVTTGGGGTGSDCAGGGAGGDVGGDCG